MILLSAITEDRESGSMPGGRRTTFNNRKQLFLYLFCYPGVAKARDTIKISINISLTSSNNLAFVNIRQPQSLI